MREIPVVQSVSNSMVKHAYSLKVPKKAKQAEDFLCEGFHLVKEALETGLTVRYLFATAQAYATAEGSQILETAHQHKIRCFEIPSKIVSYLADTVTPQGILAVVKKPAPEWPATTPALLLAAFQIQDAGNLGTLFRSAEAFGAGGILLTEGCCDPFNPKAVRASMGSLFRIPFMGGKSWEDHMAWLDENVFRSVALTGTAPKTLFELDLTGPTAFWIGTEGTGLPEALSARAWERASIPMKGKVESLNAGVAASLALFFAQFRARFLTPPGVGDKL